MISRSFCKLKSMKNHHNVGRANDIAIFFKISWNFTNFHSILGYEIHFKITWKSILEASGNNLASIWCCKVESGWILSALGSIFHWFGLDFAFIFKWLKRGFCKQSLDEQYALVAALNMAFLLSNCIFSLTSVRRGAHRAWNPSQSDSKSMRKKRLIFSCFFLLIFIFYYEDQPLILSPWPVFHSILEVVVLYTLRMVSLENSSKKLPKTSPKQW